MAGSSELWVQCLTCCLYQQSNRTQNRHISSGDLNMTSDQLSNIQEQLQRKGGYDTSVGVKAC